MAEGSLKRMKNNTSNIVVPLSTKENLCRSDRCMIRMKIAWFFLWCLYAGGESYCILTAWGLWNMLGNLSHSFLMIFLKNLIMMKFTMFERYYIIPIIKQILDMLAYLLINNFSYNVVQLELKSSALHLPTCLFKYWMFEVSKLGLAYYLFNSIV